MELSNQRSTLPALALLVALVTIATFAHAFDLASRLAQNSDSALALVAGKAIVDGNFLLSGWRLPIDNFYFTDLLPYAAFEWFLGPRASLLVLVPALTYALLVLVVLLASLHRAHTIGRNLETAAVVAYLFASPAWMGGWDPLLLSCFHVATVLAALVSLVLCAWISGRQDLHSLRVLGAALLLVALSAAAVASDPLSLIFAFGPALAILGFDAVAGRGGAQVVLVLLVSGTSIGILFPALIACLGEGFVAVNYVSNGITISRSGSNFLTLLFGVLTSIGANPLAHQGGIEDISFLVVRVIAFSLLITGAGCVILRMLVKQRAPLLDRLLCTGAVTLVAACTVSTQFDRAHTSQSVWNGGAAIRYVVPVVLLSAALAARQIPGMLERLPSRRMRNITRTAVLVLAALEILVGDWRQAAVEAPTGWTESGPASEAARWLEKQKLENGVGEYASANLITALSAERVQIRSVVSVKGRLRPYVWGEDRRWYNATPQFVIWEVPNRSDVVAATVQDTYCVCRSVVVAGYHIAVLGIRQRERPPGCRGTSTRSGHACA